MRTLLSLILSFAAVIASAQTPERLVEEVRSSAAEACVTVEYSLNAEVDDVRIEDRGMVVAQDDLWCLKGESVEIYTCADGTWILHPESKEAMVEPKWTYEDLDSFYRTILSSSGNDLDLKVVSKTLSAKKPVAYFVPETGDEWVVTDLR